MSSSILSNLAKIQKLKGRSNYQSWKSMMEGVLELEGLWDIVSGNRSRPSRTQTDATPAITGGSATSTTSPNSDTLAIEAWVTSARRAWITIDLSIANELRHITKTFSKEDPVALWKHLEKKYQPDTAIEASRLYRQLLEIQPKDDETAGDDRAS